MPIQVPEKKPVSGKLVAAGILGAVVLVALSLPSWLRWVVVMVVIAAGAGAWLFYG